VNEVNVSMRTIALLFVLILTHISVLSAQQPRPNEQDSLHVAPVPTYRFTPLLVTATRLEVPIYRVPYAVALIGKADIQRGEVGLSLDEALRAVPGVFVNNRNNPSQGDRISVRGIGSRASFGVRGIKLLLDGIPLTMPDGQAQLNNIDLGSTGRIEVLRGASSSLYGNSAGGVIHLHTQSSTDLPLAFEPRFLVGSNGLRKWQAKLSGMIGDQSYLVNVSRLEIDGYRQHSSARSTSVNAVGRRDLSSSLTLRTVFNYFDSPYLLNPSSLSKTDALQTPTKARFFVRQQGAGKRVRQGQGGVTLRYRAGNASRLEATFYGLSRSLLTAIPGRIIELDRISGGVRTVFSQRFRVGPSQLRWTMGTDLELQSDRRDEFKNLGLPKEQMDLLEPSEIFNALQFGPRQLEQNEKVFGIGTFAELELALGPQWMLTFGQRYDRYNFQVTDRFLDDGVDDSGQRRMARLSPMFGLVYRPVEAIKLYGNYSTAFQTPTTTELSNRPTGEGGFNPSLKPERIRSFELGAKGMWSAGKLEFDMAIFNLAVEDMLIPYQLPQPGSEEVFYRNAGKTQNTGAEVRLDWYPAEGLRTTLAYSYMDFVFKDYLVETDSNQLVQLAGNRVPGVPPHRVFAGLVYEHSVGAYAEANLQWVDDYFTNDFNGPPPGSDRPIQDFVNDAYLAVDLRMGFRHRLARVAVEFFLGINNLFDERYSSSIVPNAFGNRFFEPSPGRSWYNGVQITFPSQAK
jgi:iron complex outermembrane receptor protein